MYITGEKRKPSMPNKSKAKGNRFERLIVDIAKDKGYESKRAWGSDGRSIGHHPEVDLLVDAFKVQAKCRKKLPSYIIPNENVDWQVIKEDRGKVYVVLEFGKFLDLIKWDLEFYITWDRVVNVDLVAVVIAVIATIYLHS